MGIVNCEFSVNEDVLSGMGMPGFLVVFVSFMPFYGFVGPIVGLYFALDKYGYSGWDFTDTEKLENEAKGILIMVGLGAIIHVSITAFLLMYY